jgi:hypothetical protein
VILVAARKTPKKPEKRTLPDGKTVGQALEEAGIPVQPAESTPEDKRVLLEPPPTPETDDSLEDVHADLKPALHLPKLPDDDLCRFVDDFLSDRIFTSAHLRGHERENLSLVFMPIAFGYFNRYQPESLKQIGIIYENMSAAGPRAINGKPCFTSMRILHVDDWQRAWAAILKEEERRKNIEL